MRLTGQGRGRGEGVCLRQGIARPSPHKLVGLKGPQAIPRQTRLFHGMVAKLGSRFLSRPRYSAVILPVCECVRTWLNTLRGEKRAQFKDQSELRPLLVSLLAAPLCCPKGTQANVFAPAMSGSIVVQYVCFKFLIGVGCVGDLLFSHMDLRRSWIALLLLRATFSGSIDHCPVVSVSRACNLRPFLTCAVFINFLFTGTGPKALRGVIEDHSLMARSVPYVCD